MEMTAERDTEFWQLTAEIEGASRIRQCDIAGQEQLIHDDPGTP
jgi:hypothetical protein